ncbi:type VI secretion system protein TssA [Desulfovibrio sp. JC022]|uniref:type VI secretion system protein TssA n=1 Tax=Desulfovibrio sp. JC022 TaxID=2593642 RepID=UPI0013D7ADD0|nr:type VI secretion system protein TssA [Desulfovibrio sp. JC022]NDV23354.1 type VI secretion system protein TssA [Desulfovibrio sp. JC022]
MELLDLGRKPVSEEHPAGADARYEPEYDRLQQEIDKLASATAGGAVDWKRVIKLGSVILSSKSKDLKVASYLGVGLLHLKGVEGLSAGAQLLLDLITNFWDTLYPAKKRMRGRFGAISWWVEKAEKYLKKYDGGELSKEVVDLLDKRITELDAALAEKSEDAPVLRDLSGYVRHLPVVAEPEPEHPASVGEGDGSGSAASTETVPSASYVASGVGNINSSEEYSAGFKAMLSSLGPLSEYLLVNDLAAAEGYRLRRMSAWMPISSLPPAQNGRTMVPAPDGPVKDSILSQLQKSDFAGALREAESRVGEYLFWLDLSRMSAEALKALGAGYVEALTALELETEIYVQRLPGMASLSFADGTPFADPKTRSWLQSLGKSKGGALGTEDKADKVSEIMAKANQFAADKKMFEAVSIICDSINTSPSLRSVFRLRSGLTGLLTAEGQAGVAHVHAVELLEQIDSSGLEQWEPELALSGLLAAYGAMVAEGGPESATKSVEILQRISRLSPVEGLKINGVN